MNSYKMRTVIDAKKREREAKLALRQRVGRYLKVTAEMKVQSSFGESAEAIPISVVLNEITERGLFVFSPQKLIPGQYVGVTIEYPSLFYVRAQVIAVTQVPSTAGIQKSSPNQHRIWLKYAFDTEMEREATIHFALGRLSKMLRETEA